jgi:hypothetical protein
MTFGSRSHPPHRHFTPVEDAQLRELVAIHGEKAWTSVAISMPDRTERQCRERWVNYISPAVSQEPWTPEEDAILEEKVRELHHQWKCMEQYLPRRTDSQIKNRYKVIIRRRQKEEKRSLGLPLKKARKMIEYAPSDWAENFWGMEFVPSDVQE